MPYPSKIDPAAIGAVGLAVAEEEGWERWSLREVASRLGVSPNALYRHVGDRDGLAVAVGSEAARALAGAIAAATGDDPVDRLVDMAVRYLDFACERPHAYEAFIRAKPQPDSEQLAPWLACWAQVLATVAAAVPHAEEACGFALWSSLHGRVDLTRGPASVVDPRWGIDGAVRALVSGFADGGPLPSPLEPPEI
ncbi:MAG: TetR/AcrR family transcriptional regulator [Actinomycetota bacterium]